MDARLIDVLLPHLGEFLRRQIGEHTRVTRFLPTLQATVESMCHGEDIGKLKGAVDLAVRSQDLLHQGRPGSRQADDEDWIGRLYPAPRKRPDALGREE